MSVIDSINSNEFANHLGLEFINIDDKNATARFPISKSLKNPYGTLHGGVLYSAADIVCGSLACMCGKYCTTVSGSLNYLAPGVGQKYIYVAARVTRSGNHMVFVDCEIKSDTDVLLDTGSFTFFKTDIDA